MDEPQIDKPASDFKLLTGRAEFAQAALELVSRARMELALFSYDLDPRIYSTEVLSDSLKSFLLAHERARLRVLVNASTSAVRSSNRLITLGRLLPSRVEFRQLLPERQEKRDDYLVCDGRAYFHRRDPGDLEARYFTDAPLAAKELLKQFELQWQESPPAREFTDLKL